MTVRLCSILSQRWDEIDAAYYQIDLLRQRLPRLIGLVYAWCIERVSHDSLDEWLAEMNDLLPWQDIDSEAAVNLESESFLAMAAKGGG